MNVDTGEFQALRAQVGQLAGQQQADREELGRTRGAVGAALDRVEELLAGLTPGGRPAAPGRPRLRLVKLGPPGAEAPLGLVVALMTALESGIGCRREAASRGKRYRQRADAQTS